MFHILIYLLRLEVPSFDLVLRTVLAWRGYHYVETELNGYVKPTMFHKVIFEDSYPYVEDVIHAEFCRTWWFNHLHPTVQRRMHYLNK
jgi:hypothetical protein